MSLRTQFLLSAILWAFLDKLLSLLECCLFDPYDCERERDRVQLVNRSTLSTFSKIVLSAGTPGGVDKMLDIHPPSKLSKGFSYMKNGPSAKTVESVEVSDQSDQEVEMYQLLDTPSIRQMFEVPIKTKPKKTTKLRANPKPKAPPMAVAAETSPIQDPVIGVKASSIESDEEPAEPKSRRMAKPKPKPKTKSMPTPKKIVPAKRRADQAGLDEEGGYAQPEDLEVERNEIEQEQAEISKRQADRKREEKADEQWMKELETRRKKIEKQEKKLLKGKSAR
ncbi:hypothetical protein E8E11_007284 [Didymella keratinophila]|nr:hypothetical protein E8E11_007284 [Didymella keratinophila]